MMDFAGNLVQNLPEILARDLADKEDVFLSRNFTAGRPEATLASEAYPSDVLRRNHSRVAERTSYSASSETVLCSVRQGSMEDSCGDEDVHLLKDTLHRTYRLRRQYGIIGAQWPATSPDIDREDQRLYLNSFDEDWGSDSSAEVEAEMSSMSARTRQQSVTTAATSIDFLIGAENKDAGKCGDLDLVTDSPQDISAQLVNTEGGSWVDLESGGLRHDGVEDTELECTKTSHEADWSCEDFAADLARECRPVAEEDGFDSSPNHLITIPRRQSSLGHRITTVTLGETTHARKLSPHIFSHELASQLPPPSPPNSFHQSPWYHPLQSFGDSTEPESDSIVHRGHHTPLTSSQPFLSQVPIEQLSLPPLDPSDASNGAEQIPDSKALGDHHDTPHNPQPISSQAAIDQLALPPLSANEDSPFQGASFSHRQQKSAKHPKTSSVASNMPTLARVNTWLASSVGGARAFPSDLVNPSSPSSISGNRIRVSSDVLENLRLIVGNFPDIPLTTDCLTIQTIRSYARKLRHGDLVFERVSARSSDEHASVVTESPTSPQIPSLNRKASLGSLNLMNSLRDKFTSRFGQSATFPTLHKTSEDHWPQVEPRVAYLHGPPSQGDFDVKRCVNALRIIFPDGSFHLLDLLYAHIVAYNYISCLIGGLPELSSNTSRGRPQPSLGLPAGVTSLDDLRMHPDSSDTVIADFHQKVVTSASKVVIPAKAAATLGLGSSHMGDAVQPVSDSRGGFQGRFRKNSTAGHSPTSQIESERNLRRLRDEITLNVNRLIGTIKNNSSLGTDQPQDEQGEAARGPHDKELDPVLMRALCEAVRGYEVMYG